MTIFFGCPITQVPLTTTAIAKSPGPFLLSLSKQTVPRLEGGHGAIREVSVGLMVD